MSLCGYVLYIQLKKWYVKFGATGSLKRKKENEIIYINCESHKMGATQNTQ